LVSAQPTADPTTRLSWTATQVVKSGSPQSSSHSAIDSSTVPCSPAEKHGANP
jgi:hypothetical protein